VPQDPGLRAGVDLHEDGGRADEQHQQVGDAQVGEEDVRRVAHILRLHNHDGHLRRITGELPKFDSLEELFTHAIRGFTRQHLMLFAQGKHISCNS